jgi:polygalacturonase
MKDEEPSRRSFLRTLATSAGAVFIAPGLVSAMGGCMPRTNAEVLNGDATGWDRVPEILRRIVPPTFPSKDFNITSYGARGDGTTDCSAAFKSAIGACNAAGGGRVVVPPGRFLTGPIHLRSNVNLHVQDGATILFSRDPRAYLPAVFTRWEGTEMMGYSPLVYAFEQENVAISGTRTQCVDEGGRRRRARGESHLRRRVVPPAAVHPDLSLSQRAR